MSKECNILNPLQRDGVSQRQRLVKALHPSYVSVDERELKDYLLYARKYAALLRYYSPKNDPDGDWTAFIENDITTLTAIIADTDLKKEKKAFEAAVKDWKNLSLADRRTALPKLFDFHFTLAKRADFWFIYTLEGLKLQTELKKIIGSILVDALENVRSFGERANQLPSVPAINIPTANQFESIWGLSAAQPDMGIFPGGDPVTEDDMNYLVERLKQAYKKLHDGLFSIVERGEEFLNETLTDYPQHTPHITLFLAFLCIFKIARDHLNTITRRHLNFYYRDVLGLKPNPAQPDSVHMVFELAKNFNLHQIEKNTALKAGKDTNGTNRFFLTDDELIANKTKLAKGGLKSIFIEKEFDEHGKYVKVKNIHAAPIANSIDGLGTDIEEEDGKWLTFGDESMPDATVGFAIASPIFYLKEGKRTLTLTFNFDKNNELNLVNGNSQTNSIAHELKYNLKVFFSGKESWQPVDIEKVEIKVNDNNSDKIILTIVLDSGAEPFLNYDNKKLKDGFETEYPVLKITLDNNGLSAKNLCLDDVNLVEIKNKNEFEANVSNSTKTLILNFLNEAQTWQDIAGIERQDGPVWDAPGTGPGTGNPYPDYDIGEVTAKKIIQSRGARFTNFNQLYNIDGLGIDKLKDLYYSVCFTIGKIKSIARPFDAKIKYYKNALVIHENEWYKALVPTKEAYPSPSSQKWQWFPKAYPYHYFQKLDLLKLDLKVKVENMSNLILENDVGTLNPAKPFHPFGPIPKEGSKFYIGSHEVFQKKLTALKLDLVWADLPLIDFSNHYINYREVKADGSDLDGSSPVSDNHYFNIEMEILHEGKWLDKDALNSPITTGEETLFENNTGKPNPLKVISLDFNANHYEDYDITKFSHLLPDISRGFMRFKLKQDFFHKKYPKYITQSAVSQEPNWLPDEPYTPILENIKLMYESSVSINFKSQFKSDFENRIEQLFHIEPFGWKEFFPVPNAKSDSEIFVSQKLVPEFKVTLEDSEETDAEGTLYIGLQGLEPEQNVSILFQVAEGSADPELDTQPVIWSYLSHNRWFDFETQAILSDTTNGLLTSGIVKFVMPKIMSANNTRVPSETFWIKASVANKTSAVSKTIAVMPQAVKATFDIQEGNDLDRLNNALKEKTISKLENRRATIKSVLQPYATFDGKVAERIEAPEGVTGEAIFNKEYNEFYIRISERLRHKNRGVMMWDYERMVLQEFPDIYKIKCINHTRLSEPKICSPEHAPGHVKIIVLPNLRNKNAVDPLRPMVSKNQLEKIKFFLRGHISDFVKLEVRNPIFERIQVDFQVKFHIGFEEGFYTTQLQNDILKFLSPWLYDEGEDLAVGGKVHRSSIINFIEKRPYVDFLTDFKMNQKIPKSDGTFRLVSDVEEAIASTSSSVLVSVPAIEHLIGHNIEVNC